jgi:hypothetical protein
MRPVAASITTVFGAPDAAGAAITDCPVERAGDAKPDPTNTVEANAAPAIAVNTARPLITSCSFTLVRRTSKPAHPNDSSAVLNHWVKRASREAVTNVFCVGPQADP